MRAKLGWLAVIGVLVTAAGLLWWQRDTRLRLEWALAGQRVQQSECARLRQENQRIAAVLPSPAELESLRDDHAAIPELRAEIEGMRTRLRIVAEESTPRQPVRFAAGSKVVAANWRNAGTATPQASLETVLWAAAGGDVDTFANCLVFPDARVRQQAVALLERVPAELREQYGTPERVVAFLASKDVPLGAAEVTEWTEVRTPPTVVGVRVQVSAADGKAKDVNLRFSRQEDGWKLVVPGYAIAKYASIFKAPAVVGVGNR
jgi:hypothetical protein